MSRTIFALLGFSLLVVGSCTRPVPANVAAMVNGRAITYADIDKQYEAAFSSSADLDKSNPATTSLAISSSATGGAPSGDQVDIQKLEILRSLIDNEIMLQRAEQMGLMATDSDVEAKFAEMKAPYTEEEFQKQLDGLKMTAAELKAKLRRDLSVEKLLNKETTSRIGITDKEITDFYNANKSSFNLAEPQIHMAQILVTATPDPNVRNLKNDKAQDDDQARKKIQMLLRRVKQGEDFGMLAQNYSEDSTYSPSGGDLGFIAESALDKADPALRKAILALRPGETTGVLHTSEGYRILKVIAKEPAGQRELSDPQVQQTIRETLINRKDQLLKAAYYEVARNEAKVVNYYAQSIVDNGVKK